MTYNLRKGLTAHQSNNWTLRFFNIDQGDNQALFAGDVNATNDHNPTMVGRGNCDISAGVGANFRLTVNWNGGASSLYVGAFDIDGRLTGITFDPGNPTAQATWFSSELFPQFRH